MKDIQRIYVSHTLKAIALSIISIYVPAYLLTLHYTLTEVIIYFAISHTVGCLLGFVVYVPLMRKWGLINTFRMYYPLQILHLFLLFTLQYQAIPLWILAVVYGAANYIYWMPLNLLFIRHSKEKEMGSNLAKFYALPQLFQIIGPLLGALLIPSFGFWPVFVLTAIGLICSYIPLAKIHDAGLTVTLNFTSAFKRIARNKSLFLFEALDNVLEEANWFWPIYIFLMIGSLTTPGIIGSLQAIGGALFTLLVGKYANKNDKKIIPIAALLILGITVLRMFVEIPWQAYMLTIAGSFAFMLFIVSYFSAIYRTVKGEGEDEFIILREIPTLLGRLVVFAAILLTLSNLKYFFITPILFTILLLVLYAWKQKHLKKQNHYD